MTAATATMTAETPAVKRPEIPEISNERIEELLARIRPVVYFEANQRRRPKSHKRAGLYYIRPVHPRNTAFTWEPQIAGSAHSDLTEFARIKTLHEFGAPILVKPSIAEVLAQIPEELLPKVAAFRTLAAQADFTPDGEMHVATTILYTRKNGKKK